MDSKCPGCGEKQWSPMDRNYLRLFGTCWTEDKERWDEGSLSLEVFEQRERDALAGIEITD